MSTLRDLSSPDECAGDDGRNPPNAQESRLSASHVETPYVDPCGQSHTFQQLVRLLVAAHERALAEVRDGTTPFSPGLPGMICTTPLSPGLGDMAPDPPAHQPFVMHAALGSTVRHHGLAIQSAAASNKKLDGKHACLGVSDQLTTVPGVVGTPPVADGVRSKVAFPTPDADCANGDSASDMCEEICSSNSARDSESFVAAKSSRPAQKKSRASTAAGNLQADLTQQFFINALENDSEEDDNFLLQFVHGKYFSFFSAAVILINTLYIGLQADALVRRAFRESDGQPVSDDGFIFIFRLMDGIFCFLFGLELIIRAVCLGTKFFEAKERWWHVFDIIIVSTSTMELILDLIGESMAIGMSVLRSVRLVRIIRLFRLSGNIAFIHTTMRSMQTLIHALGNVITSFVPALVILFVCIYIVDLLFLDAVRTHVVDLGAQSSLSPQDDLNLAELKDAYGSASVGFLSLLAAVTGGVDWRDISKPLSEIHPMYDALFQMYVIFVMLGVLNVIAGLFVNVAQTATSMDKDLAVDEMMKEEDTFVKKLVALIQSVDADGGGSLSWDELIGCLQDDRVKAYFATLNFDVKCLAGVFDILDTDASGEVEIIKFAQGCMQYRGMAKNIDIAVLRKDVRTFAGRISSLQNLLEKSLNGKARHVEEVIDKGFY